ncbi:hypothetical protein E2C01_071119 [Portunus trituberculatus]|uniref:Uncharacterized protein n=1 Tax=Portunus trituberculatus TaxID=210409 RepID=A0A5B7I3G1_PORTR|nr:hypothetical protein [Portunus trituberculatus]
MLHKVRTKKENEKEEGKEEVQEGQNNGDVEEVDLRNSGEERKTESLRMREQRRAWRRKGDAW